MKKAKKPAAKAKYKKDRTKIDCRNCRFYAFDMDMDPFCVHEKAGEAGTDIDAFRSKRKLNFTRGPNCGPKAKYFVQSKLSHARKDPNS